MQIKHCVTAHIVVTEVSLISPYEPIKSDENTVFVAVHTGFSEIWKRTQRFNSNPLIIKFYREIRRTLSIIQVPYKYLQTMSLRFGLIEILYR